MTVLVVPFASILFVALSQSPDVYTWCQTYRRVRCPPIPACIAVTVSPRRRSASICCRWDTMTSVYRRLIMVVWSSSWRFPLLDDLLLATCWSSDLPYLLLLIDYVHELVVWWVRVEVDWCRMQLDKIMEEVVRRRTRRYVDPSHSRPVGAENILHAAAPTIIISNILHTQAASKFLPWRMSSPFSRPRSWNFEIFQYTSLILSTCRCEDLTSGGTIFAWFFVCLDFLGNVATP